MIFRTPVLLALETSPCAANTLLPPLDPQTLPIPLFQKKKKSPQNPTCNFLSREKKKMKRGHVDSFPVPACTAFPVCSQHGTCHRPHLPTLTCPSSSSTNIRPNPASSISPGHLPSTPILTALELRLTLKQRKEILQARQRETLSDA